MWIGVSAKGRIGGMVTYRSKWLERFCFVLLCVFLNTTLLAQEISESRENLRSEAKKDAERRKQQIEDVIAYGVDTDLVEVIRNLLRETPRAADEENNRIAWIEETQYNQAIVTRLEKGYSSSALEAISIRFFCGKSGLVGELMWLKCWSAAQPIQAAMSRRLLRPCLMCAT